MRGPMLVLAVCMFSLALTEAVHYCHHKTPMEGFNMDQFLGTWYWTTETPNFYSKRGDRCPTTVLERRQNGTLGYMLKYIHAGDPSKYTVLEGNIWRCSASQTDGKLVLAMPTQHGYWEARWWILDTDYTNYAASYACWFSHDGSLRAWAMGWCRERSCSEEHRNKIKQAFEMQDIDANGLEDLHEENCPNP